MMTNNTNGISTDITIDNKKLETVHSFKYLGAIVSDEGSKPEVLSRIAHTTAAVTKLKVIWNNNNIAISSKIRLMHSLAMSIFLYACETWTITADIERRIQALEMRCFHKLLGISYRDHLANEEVKARTGNAIGPYEDNLTSVKRCKLKWYGHITRSSGLAKTILHFALCMPAYVFVPACTRLYACVCVVCAHAYMCMCLWLGEGGGWRGCVYACMICFIAFGFNLVSRQLVCFVVFVHGTGDDCFCLLFLFCFCLFVSGF